MNTQKSTAFSVSSATALLSLASIAPSLWAAPPEHNPPAPHADHHSMHNATLSVPNANRPAALIPGSNVPEVNDKQPEQHSGHAAPASPDHGAQAHASRSTGKLRNPDYSDGYRSAASHQMMSSANFWSIDAEQLELAQDERSQQNSGQYELKLWYGNDYNRLYLNSSGEVAENDLEQASTSLMWWRPFSAYWNTTVGLKHDYQRQDETAQDTDLKSGQTWLGAGITGLAPYWFEVEANLYGSTGGHSQLELKTSYDLNITQKWVLQPEVELRAYGKTSTEHRYGTGLAEVNTAARLRYEITPQFAPYIGFERERFVGKTARLYKNSEGDSSSSKILLGLRFWY